jgi:membrane protein
MRVSFRNVMSELKDDIRRMPARSLATKTWGKISEDEVTTLSTSFAYFWVFAIPPLLILVVMIAALLNRVTNVPVVEHLRELIQDRAPTDMADVLLNLVDDAVAKVGGNVASFGAIATALLALWSGSNAVSILIKGFNRAYGVPETRPFLRQKIVTFGLTLMIVAMINLAFVLLVFGQRIGDWIADRLGFGTLFNALWTLARWPIAVFGILFMLTLLYWLGPNVQQPFRWLSPGSIVATILWLLVVGLFSLYLTLSNPASAYGVVGSVIVLLVFLNFTGIVFFLGAEVNAILYRVAQDAANPAPHAGDDPLPVLVDG